MPSTVLSPLVLGTSYVIAEFEMTARGVSEEAGNGPFSLIRARCDRHGSGRKLKACRALPGVAEEVIAASVAMLSDMMRDAGRNAGEARTMRSLKVATALDVPKLDRGAAMTSETRVRSIPVGRLFCAGIGAAAVGLCLAGSLGHRLALAMGVPTNWFSVDFIDPRASRVAIVLQIAFIAAVFFGITQFKLYVGSRRLLAAATLANPVTMVAGFVVYRLLPLGPEAAYVGPPSFVVVVSAFPLFLLVAFAGILGS